VETEGGEKKEIKRYSPFSREKNEEAKLGVQRPVSLPSPHSAAMIRVKR
jgi:hypothetical protein